MNKRIFLITTILIYAITMKSFAGGNHEKNEQEKIAEPSFTGTIPVDEEKVKDNNGLVAQYKDKIVGLEKAGTAALKVHPGSEVNGITLDVENGYLVYSVLMDDGTNIVVDAGTGNILHERKHSDIGNEEAGTEQREEENSSEENNKDADGE